MSSDDTQDIPAVPAAATGIRPIETALAVGGFLLLIANVAADWQSDSYGGGVVSVALIVFVGTLLGKNMGSIVGSGR